MRTPSYPLIAANDSYLVQIISEDAWGKGNVLGVLKQDPSAVFFDREGQKWTKRSSSPNVKPTFLTRLLAETVYNPSVPVQVEWTCIGAYTLEELKQAIDVQVDMDDDILTQFLDGATVKAEVNAADSFEEIIAALNATVFQFDENDERWQGKFEG